MRFQCVVFFWVIVFLYRLTLMVTLTPGFSWVLRPSLQKLPAPPQPHTSQRSVNQQTPQSIRWSTPHPHPSPLLIYLHVFLPSAFNGGIAMMGLLPLSNLSLLAVFSCVYGMIWCPRTSDGERRDFRNKNREKDRHLRRCRHRSRSGLLQLLCSLSISPPRSWMWFQKVDVALAVKIVKYWWTVWPSALNHMIRVELGVINCVKSIINHRFLPCWHVNWKSDILPLPPRLPCCLSPPFGSSWHCTSTCRLWLRP